MGKSAKLHKRVPKKPKSSSSSAAVASTSSASTRTQVDAAKKRSTLKQKTQKTDPSAKSEKGVLGGADYVSLLMGSRKKAREEAKLLPQDDS